MGKRDVADAREAYEKPEVRKIRLIQGEMAVAGCKTPSSSMGPTTGCSFAMCKNNGS